MLQEISLGNVIITVLNIFIISSAFLWWFKGNGISILLIIGIASIALMLLFPIFNFFPIPLLVIVHFSLIANRKKQEIEMPSAIFEGGGIRRGLTAPEVALILHNSYSQTIAIAIMQLLQKDFINIAGLLIKITVADKMKTRQKSLGWEAKEKFRRDSAQQLGQILFPYEEVLLEFIEGMEGKELANIDFAPIKKPIFDYFQWRVGGYNLGKTQEYYEKFVARSKVELRQGGELIKDEKILIERNFLWILMSKDNQDLNLSLNKVLSPERIAEFDKENDEKSIVEIFDTLVSEIEKGLSP